MDVSRTSDDEVFSWRVGANVNQINSLDNVGTDQSLIHDGGAGVRGPVRVVAVRSVGSAWRRAPGDDGGPGLQVWGQVMGGGHLCE